MLSPILVFTADEAWEHVPGRPAASVHLGIWSPTSVRRTEAEQGLWRQMFALREAALPELEKARQAKLIGKALEGRLTLRVPASALAEVGPHRDDLRELLNVSQLDLVADEAATAPAFAVAHAEGQKCERCWHWETDVGQRAAHPTLCGRCAQAVG